MDRIGQQLGNYRITRVLGQGGFADVYLGEHVYLKRPAALKLLRTSLKESDIERFLSEAQTLASLNHPHIVRVLEYVVEQGMPVLIMDYAEEGTVRQRHPRGSVLPLKTVVTYIKQIAAALQYAHNHNIIHRDVKPENMLFGPQQQLLLSDFGLALLTASPDLLSTQQTAGTIAYMAPEQIRGKATFASDQYALALVAYEWFCGTRPFEGSYFEFAQQHFYSAPPPLRDRVPGVPTAVEEVILRALAKDPKERFISIQAFAYALERASQLSEREDHDNDSQMTAPLSQHVASSQEVYLAASPADETFAARLKVDLQQRGVVFWHTSEEKTPDSADERVRQAIRAADLILLVVSPSARAVRNIKESLRIASIYERPLLFVWATGNELAQVLPDAWGKAAVIDLIDARESHYMGALEKMMTYLGGERSITTTLEPGLFEPQGEPRNPYKGLQAFTEHDTNDFFGRGTLVQELVEAVREMLSSGEEGGRDRIHRVRGTASTQRGIIPEADAMNTVPTARMLPVIGASGSGKSSVVMAGLLPLLQSGALPGSTEWIYLPPMVPGKRPLESLTLALAPHLPARSLTSIGEDLTDDSARGLHLLATQLVPHPQARIVLLVDQFEELFAQTIPEEERRHFIDLLVTAATEPHGPVIVILTLRIDFYGHTVNYPELYRLIETNAKTVLPMDIQDLRAVIEQPAALPDVQLTFEGNLVGDLLFEAHGQAGALPLLEFTLEQLFQHRNGHQLTLEAYKNIGGVKGALAKQAETTYTSLPSEEHRRLARALFLRLIDPGLTEQDTRRRRAALSELALPDAKQTAILREVADAFITARLLTTNEIAGVTTVEVSHEALIREWTRLADWLREGREDIHVQQTLDEDITEWERRNKPNDRLYRGSQLKDANVWAKRNIASQHEVAFLRASATRQMRALVSVIALILLLLSSTGLAVWLKFYASPDPTLVTTVNDDGPGSLRYAIANAPAGSTIRFDPSLRGKTITLSDLLVINKNLTIQGPGAGKLSIVGNAPSGAYGVLHVRDNVSVTISDLAFNNSQSSIDLISNQGTLKLINSKISDNHIASFGGSINNYSGGTLTLINSIVSGNSASIGGGGISNYSGSTLTLINSTVSHNTADQGWGGGIGNYGGTLTLINSTISDNTTQGSGGGIFNNDGTVTINNSTISGNYAGYDGGGILIVNGGTLTLSSSTVSDNQATGYGGGIDNGYSPGNNNFGGILNTGGRLKLTNSTISSNQATGGGGLIVRGDSPTDITFCTIYGNTASGSVAKGGGITIVDDGANKPNQVGMSNSLVAANHAATAPDISGTLSTHGYNLIQDYSGATFLNPNNKHAFDKEGKAFADLRLASALSGKDPQTLALLPGSPAIDAIPPADCVAVTTDQRGVKRPQGRGCDIGAYEYKAP